MTAATLKEEALKLSPEERVRFAEELLESVDDFTSPEIDAAWRAEIRRRVEEVESGKVQAIPAEQVFQEARKALNEARRISSRRSKRND